MGCQKKRRFVVRLYDHHTLQDSASHWRVHKMLHGTKLGRNTNHAQIKLPLGTAFWAGGSSTVDPRPSPLRHPCCVHYTHTIRIPVVVRLPA